MQSFSFLYSTEWSKRMRYDKFVVLKECARYELREGENLRIYAHQF